MEVGFFISTLKQIDMKRNLLPILGAIMFTLGLAMATGVELNPIQGIYAVVCMAAAVMCFMQKKEEAA